MARNGEPGATHLDALGEAGVGRLEVPDGVAVDRVDAALEGVEVGRGEAPQVADRGQGSGGGERGGRRGGGDRGRGAPGPGLLRRERGREEAEVGGGRRLLVDPQGRGTHGPLPSSHPTAGLCTHPPRDLRAELAALRDPARVAASAWQLRPTRAAPWRPRRGPPSGRAAAPCDGRRSAVVVTREGGGGAALSREEGAVGSTLGSIGIDRISTLPSLFWLGSNRFGPWAKMR